MRIVILAQEEPIFLGPFLREVIRTDPTRIAAVVLAGRRGAGEKRGTLRERLRSLRVFWLIFEPLDFGVAMARSVRSKLLGRHDPRSVEGVARRHGIPVHHLTPVSVGDVASLLRSLDPDVVLNQSEIILDEVVLQVPTLGFVNRHASLLPAHRGRLGSFGAHADESPSYGVTIHMVDEGIDTGDVLVRWEADEVDPTWPFPKVLRHLNGRAPALFWRAVDQLRRGVPRTAQPAVPAGPTRRFPTLEEARQYRERLRERRRAVADRNPRTAR